jgi:hypothetical protein
MAILINITKVTLGKGTQSFQPLELPSGFKHLSFYVDISETTEPDINAELELDISTDAGTTWATVNRTKSTDPFPIKVGIKSGMKDKAGNPIKKQGFEFDLPQKIDSNLRLMPKISVFGGNLTLAGKIEIT